MKKILFLTSADLMKSYYSGGEHACKNNLKFLQNIYGKENVDILFFSEWKGKLPEHYYAYKRLRRWKAILAQTMGYKMYFPWKEREITNLIIHINPDIVFFDGSLSGNLLPKIPDSIYTVVFEHNFEKKYYYLKMKHEGLIYALGYFAVSKCERIAVSECDTLICISERDSSEIYNEYGRKADAILPVTFENHFDSKKVVHKISKKELLFIGSNFGPNYDGILWFINCVMPDLPDFTLYVVGKDFERSKQYLEQKNVIVIGTVENLEDYYYRFPVIVIPVLYGSGMKVKTAEAMMYGRTIFATDEALEGYETENVKGVFRCNSQREFIESIKWFYKTQVPFFQEEVYRLYLDKYSSEAGLMILKNVLPSENNKNSIDELVSVITPLYNTENYVEECIKSVICQSYKNWELIIVDDGSTDRSGDICEIYSKIDRRIKVFHQNNGGQSKARNLALKKCSGHYYIFLDSDDRLADNAIENLYSAITSYKADICYGGIRLFGIGKEQELYHCGHISILDSREACRRMFLHDGLDSNTFAKIYKAELWADVRFPEGTIFEDVPIMYKIVLKSKKNVQCDFCVYEQRSREGSTTRSEFSNAKKIYTCYSWNVYQDILNCCPALREAAYMYYLYSVVDNFINLSCSRNRKDYKEYQMELKQIIIKNFGLIMTAHVFKARRLRIICCICGLGEKASGVMQLLKHICNRQLGGRK